MKKFLTLLLCLTFVLGVFASCNSETDPPENIPSDSSVEDCIKAVLGRYLPDSLRNMSAYTYNASTRLYECFDATAYGTELNGAFIGFEDGKLICFVFAFNTPSETITISGTVSYGNALIALPSADQILQ